MAGALHTPRKLLGRPGVALLLLVFAVRAQAQADPPPEDLHVSAAESTLALIGDKRGCESKAERVSRQLAAYRRARSPRTLRALVLAIESSESCQGALLIGTNPNVLLPPRDGPPREAPRPAAPTHTWTVEVDDALEVGGDGQIELESARARLRRSLSRVGSCQPSEDAEGAVTIRVDDRGRSSLVATRAISPALLPCVQRVLREVGIFSPTPTGGAVDLEVPFRIRHAPTLPNANLPLSIVVGDVRMPSSKPDGSAWDDQDGAPDVAARLVCGTDVRGEVRAGADAYFVGLLNRPIATELRAGELSTCTVEVGDLDGETFDSPFVRLRLDHLQCGARICHLASQEGGIYVSASIVPSNP